VTTLKDEGSQTEDDKEMEGGRRGGSPGAKRRVSGGEEEGLQGRRGGSPGAKRRVSEVTERLRDES